MTRLEQRRPYPALVVFCWPSGPERGRRRAAAQKKGKKELPAWMVAELEKRLKKERVRLPPRPMQFVLCDLGGSGGWVWGRR